MAVGKPWARIATPVLAAYAPLIVGGVGLLDMLASQAGTPILNPDLSAAGRFAFDAGFVVTAAAAAGFVFKPIRRDMAAFIPIDPASPVHALALTLAVCFFGTQLTFLAFTDVLASDRAQPPLTILDLFLNEVPFLVLALAGVGLFLRRNLAGASGRLGVVVPAWWHPALALAAAGLFYAIASGSDALDHRWAPSVAQSVDATTQHLFGGLTGPLGIAAVALLPGICEEILFRGALQPRIGLIATALLFTSIHTQYGLSMDTGAIFVIAIGLGLIRKYANTTTSITSHVAYNLLAGIGIGGPALGIAIGLEVVLVAVAAYGFWKGRRSRAVAASP